VTNHLLLLVLTHLYQHHVNSLNGGVEVVVVVVKIDGDVVVVVMIVSPGIILVVVMVVGT